MGCWAAKESVSWQGGQVHGILMLIDLTFSFCSGLKWAQVMCLGMHCNDLAGRPEYPLWRWRGLTNGTHWHLQSQRALCFLLFCIWSLYLAFCSEAVQSDLSCHCSIYSECFRVVGGTSSASFYAAAILGILLRYTLKCVRMLGMANDQDQHQYFKYKFWNLMFLALEW